MLGVGVSKNGKLPFRCEPGHASLGRNDAQKKNYASFALRLFDSIAHHSNERTETLDNRSLAMSTMQAKRNDYAAGYALFRLPEEREPRWDQSPVHFKKVSLLTEVNVSYSANSTSVPSRQA